MLLHRGTVWIMATTWNIVVDEAIPTLSYVILSTDKITFYMPSALRTVIPHSQYERKKMHHYRLWMLCISN